MNPSDNGTYLRFPDEFYELLIDGDSFQHYVSTITDLNIRDHIRFSVVSTGIWRMWWITRTSRVSIWVRFICEMDRGVVQRFLFTTITSIARVPMIFEAIVQTAYDNDLEWSENEGSPGMVEFSGNGEIYMEEKSPSDAFWKQFQSRNSNLITEYYQKGTNTWAAERKQLAIDEHKWGSWWMKWPEDGVDSNSIKLYMVLTWAANLEGRSFKTFSRVACWAIIIPAGY